LHAAIEKYVPTGTPTIVAGDMNCRPSSAPWEALAAQRADAFAVAGVGSAWTSSAADPRQTIDGIFVDPRLTVAKAEVVQHQDAALASDHLPVVAEIELA
jgi:endonuclease/exonuclease/phosphatase family metal-dependent hydrolase